MKMSDVFEPGRIRLADVYQCNDDGKARAMIHAVNYHDDLVDALVLVVRASEATNMRRSERVMLSVEKAHSLLTHMFSV